MFITTATQPSTAPHTGAAAGSSAAGAAAGIVDAATTIDPYDALSASCDLLVSLRSRIHALHALEATVLAAGRQIANLIADADSGKDHGEFAHRTVAAELGLAVHESDRTMTAKIEHAVTLVTDYPNTHDALLAGRISHTHARTIIDCGTNITDPAQRTNYETIALDIAERETVGRLRPLLRELAERYTEKTLDERHREANEQRCVYVQELEDGMSQLTVILATPLAVGIQDRLNQMAKRVKLKEFAKRRDAQHASGACTGFDAGSAGAGGARAEAEAEAGTGSAGASGTASATGRDAEVLPVRGLGQIRADLFADMLLCADPGEIAASGETGLGAIQARLQVITPRARLTPQHPRTTGARSATESRNATERQSSIDGRSTQGTRPAPASLAGYGPIDTDTARFFASTSSHWDDVTIDPDTGRVITVDTYRPSAELRRYLRARDQHCRYPGCRTPLDLCDIDHTVDAALGGETSSTNTAHLCRRHHTFKHHSRWTVSQDPDGTLNWVSPTGRDYREPAPSSVRFQYYSDRESEPNPEEPDRDHPF